MCATRRVKRKGLKKKQSAISNYRDTASSRCLVLHLPASSLTVSRLCVSLRVCSRDSTCIRDVHTEFFIVRSLDLRLGFWSVTEEGNAMRRASPWSLHACPACSPSPIRPTVFWWIGWRYLWEPKIRSSSLLIESIFCPEQCIALFWFRYI
jgi:hypothetical protein